MRLRQQGQIATNMILEHIQIGKSYKMKMAAPHGPWARAIEILGPNENDNFTDHTVVVCVWTVDKNQTIGMIKHFKPSDLIDNYESDVVGEMY